MRTLVVGDHGMADVHACIDPRSVTDRLSARHFVDSTLLRVWGDARALEAARGAIERARWPGRWLDAEALDARRAPTRGAPYGDAIFVLAEGALFAPSHVGGRVRGMHGYDLGARSCGAALATDLDLPSPPARLEDAAGVVRSAMGLS